MRQLLFASLMAALAAGSYSSVNTYAASPPKANAQLVLEQSAAKQKYTFLLFYRDDNSATREMVQMLQTGLSQHGDQASLAYVSVTDPAEQAVVKRFGVFRAPLPFVLAVAPNGAITTLASQKITNPQIASAFVTPAMADCMKAMQERKLVLVCVSASARSQLPAVIIDFQTDPEFKDRLSVVAVQANDPSESQFLKQMEITPASIQSSAIVFMAPPAVLVGKFPATVTKSEMAAALHAAGQCCDDPNCKHSGGPQAATSPSMKRK